MLFVMSQRAGYNLRWAPKHLLWLEAETDFFFLQQTFNTVKYAIFWSEEMLSGARKDG